MEMGLEARDDLELGACQIQQPKKVEKDYEQNLSRYPCSNGTYTR